MKKTRVKRSTLLTVLCVVLAICFAIPSQAMLYYQTSAEGLSFGIFTPRLESGTSHINYHLVSVPSSFSSETSNAVNAWYSIQNNIIFYQTGSNDSVIDIHFYHGNNYDEDETEDSFNINLRNTQAYTILYSGGGAWSGDNIDHYADQGISLDYWCAKIFVNLDKFNLSTSYGKSRYRSIVSHEIGHVLGLGNMPMSDVTKLMCADSDNRSAFAPTNAEKNAVKLLYTTRV